MLRRGAIFVATVVTLLSPCSVLAAEFKVSEQGATELGKSEQAKNLYIVGEAVNISGSVLGDLTAAGGTLNVTGVVEDSLLAGAGTINIQGNIGKNVRAGASSVVLSGVVGEDMLSGSATLSVGKDSTIKGDLVAGSGQATIDGTVKGKLRISAESIIIKGRIEGDADIYANEITIADGAYIGGKLTYHAPREANISQSAEVLGEVEYLQTQVRNYNGSDYSSGLASFGLVGLIAALALLFALVYILPKTSKQLVAESIGRFWMNAGVGFATMVVVPIALIVLALTILGMKIAGVILLGYIVALAISGIFATLVAGSFILKLFTAKEKLSVDWRTILIGSLAMFVLALIPFVGQLIIFIIMLAVFGQLSISTGRWIARERS